MYIRLKAWKSNQLNVKLSWKKITTGKLQKDPNSEDKNVYVPPVLRGGIITKSIRLA